MPCPARPSRSQSRASKRSEGQAKKGYQTTKKNRLPQIIKTRSRQKFCLLLEFPLTENVSTGHCSSGSVSGIPIACGFTVLIAPVFTVLIASGITASVSGGGTVHIPVASGVAVTIAGNPAVRICVVDAGSGTILYHFSTPIGSCFAAASERKQERQRKNGGKNDPTHKFPPSVEIAWFKKEWILRNPDIVCADKNILVKQKNPKKGLDFFAF